MPSPPANELPALWRPHQSVLRPPNFYRSGQSAAAFNGSSVLFFGGCAHGQCHNDLMVLRTPSFTAHCPDVHCSRTWAHARAVDFSGAPGGPSPRQGALMAVLGRWAWLVGGSGGDLTIDAYKLDLAPRYAPKETVAQMLRPNCPSTFETPRQRQIKLRAAYGLGKRPIGRCLPASLPYRPCVPRRHLILLARMARWCGCARRSWAGRRQRPSTSQARGWAPPCSRSAAAAVRAATRRCTRSTRRCSTAGTRGSSCSSWAAPPHPHLRRAAGTASRPVRRWVGCSSALTLTLTLILILALTLSLTRTLRLPGGLLVHGGCDRQRCYEDTWLLELAGNVYAPDNNTVAEARWRQLQPQSRGGGPSLTHGAMTGGTRGHACVTHGSWLVVHGGCDLAGRCSSDVRVLEVERTTTTATTATATTITTGNAPPGGAGGASSGDGGASGALSGAGSAFGGVNASLTARWVAVRVEGAAPRPRAFHVAIALDSLHDGGTGGSGGGSGGGDNSGGSGGNGGGSGGGARVLLLGGCAPILGTASTSAAATPLWVCGAAP